MGGTSSVLHGEARDRFSFQAALAALGIVYGDLGTSPLYALQTVAGAVGQPYDLAAGLGMLSLIVWALIVTVSVKYCLVVMRADNNGEGGILALMSLMGVRYGKRAFALVAMGLFGASLLYGDGVITPAISVLSALEGLNVATDMFKPYIVPGAVAILLLLFLVQPLGTARIGKVFGPVMLVWFLSAGVLGLGPVLHHPEVLRAIDPRWGLALLAHHGWHALPVLGGVVLAITGGEALYADMGHIGRAPIRVSWFVLILPALLLSYAGQVAMLMDDPKAAGNPFFAVVPHGLVYPMVGLAMLATIIASQAIITGSFSLTRQAMQLGWFPGLTIRQTSSEQYGQIYVPFVNWTMLALTLALTVGFGSSGKLANAYGIAVSTTMLLTTVLLFVVMRERWRWKLPVVLLAGGVFLIVDGAMFAGNLVKVAEGGWIPLLLGAILFMVMITWRRGLAAMRRRVDQLDEPRQTFLHKLQAGEIRRLPGTGVFLTGSPYAVPELLRNHPEQFGALPERAIALTVQIEDKPRVAPEARLAVEEKGPGLWQIVVRFGFVEVPNVGAALCEAKEGLLPEGMEDAIFYAGNDDVIRHPDRGKRLLPAWQRMLFGVLRRNAVRPADTLDLPRERFLEIGRQLQL